MLTAQDEATLRELEDRLTNPSSSETPETLAALLAPEFREFGSSGRIFETSVVLEGLLAGGRARVTFDAFHVTSVVNDVALVIYISRSAPGPGWKRPALRSSLWRRGKGSWQLVFHQGTEVDSEAVQL